MNEHDRNAEWEEQLRQGLDQLSDLNHEEPPNLAALQMLVVEVQAEQRRKLKADLLKFWGVGVTLLTFALAASARQPLYFLAWQGAAALLLLAGAFAWRGGKKRVME